MAGTNRFSDVGVILARGFLGGVFVYASLDKIAHPDALAEIIFNYKILPDVLINLAAMTLPWVELLAGLTLISGRATAASAAILTGLTLAFSVAISYNLARGLDFHCGCFTTSPSAARAGWYTLGLELVLMLVGGICLIAAGRRQAASVPPSRA
jgi:uncharacterized membrane protein YphA (DoxX/SURF4 family)